MNAKIYRDLHTYAITSTISKKDFDLLAKYEPDALTLFGGEGEDRKPLFTVAFAKGAPSVGAKGVQFSDVNTDGKLMIKGDYPDTLTDEEKVKEYVADIIGKAQMNLQAVEAQVAARADAVGRARTELIAGIDLN